MSWLGPIVVHAHQFSGDGARSAERRPTDRRVNLAARLAVVAQEVVATRGDQAIQVGA